MDKIEKIKEWVKKQKKEELARNSIGVITGKALFVDANELLSFLDTLSEEPMQKFNTDKLQEIAKPATSHKKPTPEDRAKFMEELHEYAESKKPDKSLEEEYKDYVENDPVYSKLVNGIAGRSIARHFAEWGAEHLRDSTKMIGKSLEEAAEAYQQQVIEETKNHIHLPQHTYAEGFEDALHLISDAFIAGWEYRSECEESSIMGDLLKTILRVGAQHNFGFGPDLRQRKDNEDESK